MLVPLLMSLSAYVIVHCRSAITHLLCGLYLPFTYTPICLYHYFYPYILVP